MISEDTLLNLINKYQTNAINIRREYFQHVFLSYFYRQLEAVNVFFKGGTALRLLYHSPRFSEDLDFNCAGINFKGIEHLLEETLLQIEKENIKFNLKEIKETSGGALAVISFTAFEQPIDIRLEISLRRGENKGEVRAVTNDFVPSYNLVSVTQEQLVAGKMAALLSRKKPRDFYDLYFILRARLLPPQEKKILPEVLDVLTKSAVNFELELKSFLPKSHWLIIKDFKETLKREIKNFL